VWSKAGDELFFLSRGGHLAAAQIQATATTFSVGRITQLFDASGFDLDAFNKSFAVTPNDDAFVFIARRRTLNAEHAPRIVWVENWFADLKERLEQ
jgi:hypothetical protein